MKLKLFFITLAIALLAGCVGRTGKTGIPIGVRFATQLQCVKVGQSTPDDLKRCFSPRPVALKESKLENGKKIEVWEVARGGNMDVGAFLMWGYVAYDKDQEIIFRFEDGVLASIETLVLPDPIVATNAPAKSPRGAQ